MPSSPERGRAMSDTDMGGMCSCDLDYDEPRIYNKATRQARKRHKCFECDAWIEPGTVYEHVSGLYDGAWFTFKTHLPCAGIRRDFCCNMHGAVDNTFEETYGFSPWEVPRDD
jgi:hypothetical protein